MSELDEFLLRRARRSGRAEQILQVLPAAGWRIVAVVWGPGSGELSLEVRQFPAWGLIDIITSHEGRIQDRYQTLRPIIRCGFPLGVDGICLGADEGEVGTEFWEEGPHQDFLGFLPPGVELDEEAWMLVVDDRKRRREARARRQKEADDG